MGTNYYWHADDGCPTCGNSSPPKHIGKSSMGWCFSLHVYPDEGITDLHDWEAKWKAGHIENEYGHRIDAEAMSRIIRERGRIGFPPFDEQWLTENHAVRGPSGLARHALGHGVVAQGAGSWDCITSDFS